MLQAEEDRDLVRRQWADQAREKELMGTETKVYHTDRLVHNWRSGGIGWRFLANYYVRAGSFGRRMRSRRRRMRRDELF